MRATHVFRTIDTHTGGNPTRTIVAGAPKLRGATMAEKMLDMKRNHDWIRRCLMYEPRGHEVMSGAVLVEPCREDADFGVIYIETGGYLPMCGHDTIGFCTAVAETGMAKTAEPFTTLRLDTPAGLVEAELAVEAGKVKTVSFVNVPSFLYDTVEIDVPDLGRLRCDIAYGGNFYAIVDARKIGLALVPANASRIVSAGIAIREAVNAACRVVHPEAPYIEGVTHVEFYTDPASPEAHLKNAVVIPPGAIDRSPCGTGTSAKVAAMFAKGELGIGEPFVYESITGSLFTAEIVGTARTGPYASVINRISGSAWITGMHTFIVHEEDEFRDGFLLIPRGTE